MHVARHKVAQADEVELVEHLGRGAAVLGDALGSRVVDERGGVRKVLAEFDAEVEKDLASNVASVRFEDVDGERLNLGSRPPPVDGARPKGTRRRSVNEP